jgi:hypothetical protein
METRALKMPPSNKSLPNPQSSARIPSFSPFLHHPADFRTRIEFFYPGVAGNFRVLVPSLWDTGWTWNGGNGGWDFIGEFLQGNI